MCQCSLLSSQQPALDLSPTTLRAGGAPSVWSCCFGREKSSTCFLAKENRIFSASFCTRRPLTFPLLCLSWIRSVFRCFVISPTGQTRVPAAAAIHCISRHMHKAAGFRRRTQSGKWLRRCVCFDFVPVLCENAFCHQLRWVKMQICWLLMMCTSNVQPPPRSWNNDAARRPLGWLWSGWPGLCFQSVPVSLLGTNML